MVTNIVKVYNLIPSTPVLLLLNYLNLLFLALSFPIYTGVCTLAHKAVYCVFSHRKELNFTSLLDNTGYNAQCDSMILYI